jgi:hypothetical protein
VTVVIAVSVGVPRRTAASEPSGTATSSASSSAATASTAVTDSALPTVSMTGVRLV